MELKSFKEMSEAKKVKFAQLLGMLLGDGGISVYSGNYELYFVQKYKEPTKYFEQLVFEIFTAKGKVTKRKDGMYVFRLKNKHVVDYITTNIKEMLACIKNSKKLSINFLRAFYGCEGYITTDGKGLKIELANLDKTIKQLISEILVLHHIKHKVYEKGVEIRRKDAVERFIKTISILPIFRVTRGKFANKKKTRCMNFYSKFLRFPNLKSKLLHLV